MIPKRATKVGTEFGLLFVIFSEFGIIANHWKNINAIMPMQGYGVGIRVPFPMVSVIRVDLAWGLHNGEFNRKPVLHLALQQKFSL